MRRDEIIKDTTVRCRNPVEHYELDSETHDYFASSPPVQADIWQRLRMAAVQKLEIRDGMHIVDVGSGGGWFSKLMQSYRVDVLSIDLSLNNLKRITGDNQSTTGIMATASHLPVAADSVDAVIASEVIEHLNNPAPAIREFLRIVKPGGRVVITTPYKEDIKMHLCIHCNKLTPANAHLHSFDEEKLTDFFSRGGAHEIYYHRIGNKAFLITRLSYILRWLPLWTWILIDSLFNLFIRKPAHIIVCGIKRGKH